MNNFILTELRGVVARHGSEFKRLDRACDELQGRVPEDVIEALEEAQAASLKVIVECRRAQIGVTT